MLENFPAHTHTHKNTSVIKVKKYKQMRKEIYVQRYYYNCKEKTEINMDSISVWDFETIKNHVFKEYSWWNSLLKEDTKH